MKIRILLCALAFTASLIPGLRAEDGDTELQGKMQKMSQAFRPLRAQLADATKNEDSLAKVATIKENATEALKLTPIKIAAMPAADQPKALEGFQAELKKLIAKLDDLTAALKAGKNDEATKIYADLGALQKEGHTEYKAAPKKK
jgi:cytochrome c556